MKTCQTSGLEAAMREAREMKAGSRYDADEGEMERFAGQLPAAGKLRER